MTHYHKGQRCSVPLCGVAKDPCPYADSTNGPCTLFEGHPTGPLFGSGSPGGHLFGGYVPTDSGADESERRARSILDSTFEDPRPTDGADVPDLGDVLSGVIPSSAVLSQDLVPGYPDVPKRPVRVRAALPGAFVGPSAEDIEAWAERIRVTMHDIGEQIRQSVVPTASTRTLVAALIERARTESMPAPSRSIASTVDDVAEQLAETELLTAEDVRVIRAVIVHLVERRS